MGFKITADDKTTSARAGVLETDRGEIRTPIFMPVGTLGTVKSLRQSDLTDIIQADIILANTYHLYLRPGMEIIESAEGVHNFINWQKPMLTDSGGYQVYSLGSRRKITADGVKFSSHIDGSYHFFSPEFAIEIQHKIGADIIMAFDECTPYPCDYSYAKKSMQLTHNWLDRCIEKHNTLGPSYGKKQIFAPIVQGSTYKDLRKISAETIASKDCEINAIGGLSTGEPAEEMYGMTEIVCGILPKSKPRYLMGVGTPENLLECISLGIDMFDCVLPSRNARHGLIYTKDGSINIKNRKWANVHEAIDPDMENGMSNVYTKAYLRHLIHVGEMLGAQIATLQNLCFYLWLVRTAREKIEEGVFGPWKEEMVKKLSIRL